MQRSRENINLNSPEESLHWRYGLGEFAKVRQRHHDAKLPRKDVQSTKAKCQMVKALQQPLYGDESLNDLPVFDYPTQSLNVLMEVGTYRRISKNLPMFDFVPLKA